jgi:hypothetical protein
MKRLIALIAACGSIAAAATHPPVPYPEGYRAFTHVKSMLIERGHALYDSFGGLHHLYANEAAMEGYRTGTFPDGAVIVFDLLDVRSEGNAVTEGPRKLVGVMHRDARRYEATGGWGFEGFAGDSRTQRLVGEKAADACFACHRALAPQDFVISDYRP